MPKRWRTSRKMDVRDLFWERVDRSGECWLWLGCKRGGYGQFHAGYKIAGVRSAHQFSFWIKHGRIARPMTLHKCNNKACVNPNHLYEGDAKQNALDAISAGTHSSVADIDRAIGERNGRAKLTIAQVTQIKKLLKTDVNRTTIARTFNIHRNTLYAIIYGKNWKHVL